MSEEMEKLRADLEQLQGQVAQMREVLEAYVAAYNGNEAQDYQDAKWLFDKATKVLSTPAPAMVPADEYDRTIQAKAQCEQALDKVLQELKAFVPADKARVLAEALAYIDAREEIGYVSYCGMTNNRIRVEEALAIARELGLLEEKS